MASEAALPLISRLAHAARLTDVLPDLHQHALQVTGGSCTLLFEHNPRSGLLHSTSGYAVDELNTDAWHASDAEDALIAATFARGSQTLVVDLPRQMPDLALRINTPSALLLPIARGDVRIAILVVGFDRAPEVRRVTEGLEELRDMFLTALEICRLRRHEALQRDLRELLEELAAMLATSMQLDRALEYLCQRATRLFAADRISVWLHDRRARELVLYASSDDTHLASGVRVSTDDAFAPAAVAMRQARAGLADGALEHVTEVITVPLRGIRRSLGTLLLEGVRIETGSELDVLDRADDMGQYLAAAIETTQLIEEVRRGRREMDHAVDALPYPVVVIDRQGRITHANEAFGRRVQTPRDRLIERPVSECVGPELAGWLSTLDRELASVERTPAVCEVEDPVLGGSLSVTAVPIRDAKGAVAGRVLVARDNMPHSAAELEREELHKQLTQSEKLAALGQFVAGIAHELNNPLQSVLGHLELLRVTGNFPKPIRQQIQTVSREADRAAKIVRNLLVFAGSGRAARRSVSVNALLRRVVSIRQHACRVAHIQIVRHYDEKLPRIKSDPLMLHQVFLNMMVNAEQAIVAAGRPGRIEITTETAPDGTRILASVRDTGNGIPENVMSRVFEPFYTTKEVGKGTGLGLAIAYGIVHDHGGDITVANDPDGGAIFTVDLPCGPSHD
jgi:two-component system NtrC family sensor kinase